jgi:hypothetical protein
MLLADVSELSIGSIFIGRWMKNGWAWGVWCIYVSGGGCRRAVAEPMGRGVAGRGGGMHNPKESKLHLKHGENLKSRINIWSKLCLVRMSDISSHFNKL